MATQFVFGTTNTVDGSPNIVNSIGSIKKWELQKKFKKVKKIMFLWVYHIYEALSYNIDFDIYHIG